SIKIDPPTLQSAAFVLDLSPPPSPRTLLSPRNYRSHPAPIRELPDSSSLLCGPRLSPPPPIRFRVLSPFTHQRTRSAPTSLQTFAATPPPSRRVSHTRTKSLPPLSDHTSPTSDFDPNPNLNHATKLCHSPHRDLAVCHPGLGGIRHLCGPEQGQPVCEEGEGAGRRRRVTRTVRFQLDEKDTVPPVDEPDQRSVSGLLRLEDERDTWF
ncbi:hypothetical protein A1O3_03276, partial [Capronia epimyces CBS 606.96]